MKIEVKIDPAYQEPSVVILTDVMTEEINDILKKLSESAPQVLSGIRAGSLEVLEQEDLIRAYANQGKVFAVIWLIQYAVGRRVVKKMNAKLK